MSGNSSHLKDFHKLFSKLNTNQNGFISFFNYRKFSIYVWVGLTLFALFILRSVFQTPTVVAEELSLQHLSSVPRRYDDNQTAFVFGATGIYSTSELFKCMAAIESLSKIGGWDGHVYLLLDSDSCLDRKFIKSLPNKNVHVVPIKKERRRKLRTDMQYESFNSTSTRRILMNSQPFERSMAVKMHLLDYLPSHIQYAAWYDCDVLFVKPGCAKDMVDKKPPITPQKPIFTTLPGHVGAFVVKTDVSQPALKQWHDTILTSNSPSSLGDKPAIPDYEVFNSLFGKDPNASDTKFGILNRVWEDVMPRLLAPNSSIYWNATECAIHLSNGRCRNLGAHNVNKLVKGLHLSSYEGKGWCPSLIRRKFKTYGIEWPFCWNPPFLWDGSN